MIWQEWAKTLKSVLKLKGSPVSITYSLEPLKAKQTGKHWVCQALLDARDGKVINLTKENSICMGGTTYLGLAPRPTGKEAEALKKFLVHGEKLFCSIAVFNRAMALSVQPPLGLADNVIFAPLEKAPNEPDLVLFICNAKQTCRLLTLATYWNGVSPKTHLIGSACSMAITYPLISGEINVSFLDYTARRMRKYSASELIVSIPYFRLPEIITAIDRCSAGTAEVEIPPEFQQLIEGLDS